MTDFVCPVVRADVTCYWKDMWRRLDAMRRLWQLCDVRLRTDDGCSFMAHSPVLAASSDVLHHMLVAARHETFVDGPGIVPVRNVTPDVLRITLDFIYGVTPTSRADFERLRVGAARLGIEGAYEYCCRRLGENVTGFHHASNAAPQPAGLATVTAESAPVLVPSGTAVSDSNLASQTVEVPAGNQNSADQNAESDAAVSTSSVLESTVSSDVVVVPPNDVDHAEVMAHMSLADLARSDECPHLRRLAGEIPSAPNLDTECLMDESGSSLDNSDFLDSVPPKKRVITNPPSDGQGSCVTDVNGLFSTEMVRSDDSLCSDTVNQMALMNTRDLSLASETVAAMPLCVEAPESNCQPIVNENITDRIPCTATGTVNQTDTTSGSIVEFGNPSFAASSFSTSYAFKTEVMTNFPPGDFNSCADDSYALIDHSNDSSWLTDQHFHMPVMSGNLPTLTASVQPPVEASSFECSFTTSNTTGMEGTVHHSTVDVVGESHDILNGCPQDVTVADSGISPNQWQCNVAASTSQTGVNGISPVSLPADNGVMYFGHSSNASSIPHFVPPVFIVNPSSSSSSSCASVAAAVSTTADLSYISLDDISAVLTANGFSHKTSLPSVSELYPPNHTPDTCTSENQTCDINSAGNQSTINETVSSVTRVCIFCQKPCKSER